MRKITSFLFSIFVGITFLAAEEIPLTFEEAAERSQFAYTSSQSSEFPIAFAIENKANRNMYRFFDGTDKTPAEGGFPAIGDYKGIYIEFDYASKLDVPELIQLFFSTSGFTPGSYPYVSDLFDSESDAPVVTVNFADYDHLNVDAGTFFNRFGIRFDSEYIGTQEDGSSANNDESLVFPGTYPIVEVKIKEAYLIGLNDEKVYFDYKGGGMYNAAHSYRVYGSRAAFTLGEGGFISWDLSEENVKYININLSSPLTQDVIDKLIFESDEFVEVDAENITGFEVGSTFISLNLSDVSVGKFSFYTEEGGIELFVDKIALAESPSAVPSILQDNNLPPFVNVYTLTGQVIKQNVAREFALEGLSNGIYIVNNKKVVVNK